MNYFLIQSFKIALFWLTWDSKLSLGAEMTQLNKFDDLNGWFLCLGTRMIYLNKFRERDDTDEQVGDLNDRFTSWRMRMTWQRWTFTPWTVSPLTPPHVYLLTGCLLELMSRIYRPLVNSTLCPTTTFCGRTNVICTSKYWNKNSGGGTIPPQWHFKKKECYTNQAILFLHCSKLTEYSKKPTSRLPHQLINQSRLFLNWQPS